MTTEAPASRFFREWPLGECRTTRSKKVPAPHQKLALGKISAWYGNLSGGDDGGILVLPTGGGKTFTAVHFLCTGPLSDGYKVLWLAHTHHLLEQAFLSFEPELLGHIREPRPSLSLRVVSGTPGHFPPRDIRPSDDVVIATLQTVTNAHREALEQLRAFIQAAKGKLFVVFDEAHHSPAPSYRKLLMDLRGEGAVVLGLTATPTYADESKKGWLKKLFPRGILAQARAGELIAQGILAKPHFERAKTSVTPNFREPDYQKWLGTYRDIPEDVIDHLARNAERNSLIAKTYTDHRDRYGKTIIFTDRWYQCEAIVESLRNCDVRADAVYSHVDAALATVEGRRRRSSDENGKVLERFRKNELDVIVNVRMLTEGTDVPDAQTVFLTRQTTSQILLTQMVGRALRGPKFGGTPEAFIVSFIDDWRQKICWAEYEPLADGQADEGVRVSPRRPPLQLISIDLVKRLARQMDSGVNVMPGPFTSLMPSGWYAVTFDVSLPDSDEIESSDQLVMVFEDEKKGFGRLIADLVKVIPREFERESATLEALRPTLDEWRSKYLHGAARSCSDLLIDIFQLARHIAQGHGAPEFFPFEVREDHDLDRLAKDYIGRDLGPKAIHEGLRAEYERKDRFWSAFYPRFEWFRSQYEGCQGRLLGASDGGGLVPTPRADEVPSFAEPDEEVKKQVMRRDGNHCLACGSTRGLQADHILPAYRGGTNQMDQLQTLCKVCNAKKGTRTIFFTSQHTRLQTPPAALAAFDAPRSDDAGDKDHWERFLRRTINFTFECSAVSAIKIGGRRDAYYNWTIELVKGNSAGWIKPHLPALVGRIQEARENAGKPPITSLKIVTPGEKTVDWSS